MKYINSKNVTLCFLVFFMLSACTMNVIPLKSSSQISQTWSSGKVVKNIRRFFWSDSLVVTTFDKKKIVIACDSLWGIKYKDGTVYRNYNDQYYLLRQNSIPVIYSQTHSGHNSSHTSYYFSKDLDSDIYSMKIKNFKKYFQGDECFLNKIKKDLKWYQNYSAFDKKNKTFYIVKFYKECHP
ncbi:MAG: hypothetical protein HYX39_07200 [Bacteroidetes bacterium]|nr:hypothetical protein [Bacteroidota bacterium]